MGFDLQTSVPVLTVFLQGILSFFSPCVLPLVPVYIGYLAGGTKIVDEDGSVRYPRGKVLMNTLCFILGVSFAFFLLGLGFTALGRFFAGNRLLFARIGGVIVIFFGLLQLGAFGTRFLKGEHRLPLRLNALAMNPFIALLLGFVFSFAWTPCVGPALTSVLVMASSANSAGMGFLLIGVYTLGFVLPFLAVGLFTSQLLALFKRYKRALGYTVKVGGALMILMGVMMLTGWMNGVTGYLSQFGVASPPSAGGGTGVSTPSTDAGTSGGTAAHPSRPTEEPKVAAPDFTLTDQYGKTHSLSDYRGQVVFLNFWATWCGPCQAEMPDIQRMYEARGGNAGDLVVLGVANPRAKDHPGNIDVPADEVKAFLKERGYTYPVVMDTSGDVFATYGVNGYPTTFMIDRDGNVFGYLPGMLTDDMMQEIVRQTMEGRRP